MDALLGYTGLVGSHLRENLDPDTTMYYNSKNFCDALNLEFKDVYCACVPAVKWLANKNASQDFAQIDAISNTLTKLKFTGMFVHVSTIDVHEAGHSEQTEACECSSQEPYGRHRYLLENQLRETFGSKLLIVRLPALFGVGLKKNMLFDLLEDHRVESLNINTAFQWYSLSWLWEDLLHIRESLPSAGVVNLYPKPIESKTIVSKFFPELMHKLNYGPRLEYNQSSKYPTVTRSTSQVMSKMRAFINMYRYIKGPNHMVVSNMAWDPPHENHAIFLLKRFGVRYVEVLPTKYTTWQSFLESPEQIKQRFAPEGLQVYSLQSLLYGVQGDFLRQSDELKTHLRHVLAAAARIGCRVAVLGSPSTRVSGLSEESFRSDLDEVQTSAGAGVKLCLEPNAREYGCRVGTDLASVERLSGISSFYMNFDTGNALMSRDSMPQFPPTKIAHVQISAPRLVPMTRDLYYDLDELGMTNLVSKAICRDASVKVSLEVRPSMNLGYQIRQFCAYCARSFATLKKI